MNPFKIYLCENQPVTMEGLRCILDRHIAAEVVGHAPDISAAMVELPSLPADILLLGQPFSARSILPLFSQAQETTLRVATVLWVNDLSEVDSFRALHMGARGILRKSRPTQTLIECLDTVAAGSIYLEGRATETSSASSSRNRGQRITPREREIVRLVCRGMRNKEIADAMCITPGTVKVHLMHIFEKTGAKDRFQLALQGRHLLLGADQEVPLGTAAHA